MSRFRSAALLLLAASASRAAEPIHFETLGGAGSCDAPAAPGDHVLVRYSVQRPLGSTVAELAPHENLYHLVAGEAADASGAGGDALTAVLARGVAGACPGARRRVPVAAAVFAPFETADAYNPNVIGGRVVNGDVAWPVVGPLDSALAGVDAAFELEVVHVTSAKDHAIFAAIPSNATGAMRLVSDEHLGVNARDAHGSTPLMLAINHRLPQLVATILNAWSPRCAVDDAKPSGHNPLFYAVASKETSIVKALLKRGADPNAALKTPDARGYTPLHFACRFGEVKLIDLLLEYGADPMAISEGGESVMDAAAQQPYSTRKKLADMLNEAMVRREEAEKAGGGRAGAGAAGADEL